MTCCKVPGCRNEATTELALVSLCEFHRELAEQEQADFYDGNKSGLGNIRDDRRLFYKIIQHMPYPWRKRYIYPPHMGVEA
ncbi:hypothetical protein [Paenibacillus alvei]|uniref:hypothetical protein n=1 Tax=Paenibacillus alvei TaxID=44250 RepID=UPI00227E4B92|nr:hypothetical protein [Paenibacillus alvei]MCY7485784.1 hypothetical protein [Paenibacillus alvei]